MKRPAVNLVTMAPAACKALARTWFLKGFASSGKGFNGENYDPTVHPALESLLISHFDKVWSDDNR